MAERIKEPIPGETGPCEITPPAKPPVKKVPKPKKPETMQCKGCLQQKTMDMFYKNTLTNGMKDYPPFCKECVRKLSIDESGKFSAERLYDICQKLKRPFYATEFRAVRDSLAPESEKVDIYFAEVEKRKTGKIGFDKSDDISTVEEPEKRGYPLVEEPPKAPKKPRNAGKRKSKGKMTDDELDECKELFGGGLTAEQYERAKYLFDDMSNNYPLKTSMHKQKLAEWAVYKTMLEVAISNGDANEAAKWGKLAKDTATDAKINPSQLSAADLSEGMTCFSQLSTAVEKAVDVIRLFPEFREQPKDRVDYTLWEYINCSRHMMGKPLIEYREIYSYLDKRAQELKGRYSFIKKEEDGHFDENDIGGDV